jgi:hypothetical protein
MATIPNDPDRSTTPTMREVSQASGKPIFVDRSGRRRRLVRLAGAVLGSLLVAALGLLGAAVSGASPLRIPGFPDVGHHAGGENATPVATPGTAASPGPVPTPRPLPRPSISPVGRQNPATPTVAVTASVATTQHGRSSTHPTPSKSR